MYMVQDAFHNLVRHKKRYITTGVLLLAAFSVLVCAIFHYRTFDGMIENYKETLLPYQYIKFRDELHFLGSSARAYNEHFNHTWDENGIIWFDSEAMAVYNHPYPFTREMLDAVAKAGEVESHELVYIETGYRATDTPEELLAQGMTREKAVVEHYIVGGNRNHFMGFAASDYDKIYWASLTSGREPEDGECLISAYYAEKYNLSIGDTLTLYDDSLHTVTAELTVSGMVGIFYLQHPYTKQNLGEIEDFYFKGGIFSLGGTPFDRIGVYDPVVMKQSNEYCSLGGSFLNVVFTTFDTAYYLHGDETADTEFTERHHFNKYLANYKLKEGVDAEAFAETAVSILSEYTPYAEEFTVSGSFAGMYDKLEGAVSYHWKSAKTCMAVGAGMAGIILLLALITNIRERKGEIGVLYSLGVSEANVSVLFGLESAMISGISAVAAQLGSYLMHLFTMFDSNYIRQLEMMYQLTGWGIAVIPMAAAAGFGIGWICAAVYLQVKSPVEFLKME